MVLAIIDQVKNLGVNSISIERVYELDSEKIIKQAQEMIPTLRSIQLGYLDNKFMIKNALDKKGLISVNPMRDVPLKLFVYNMPLIENKQDLIHLDNIA